MNIRWSEKQKQLHQRYRDFGDRHVRPRAAECWRASRFDRDSWEALVDEGFWRIPVPVELGGDGGDWWDFFAAFEGLCEGSGDFGFTATVGGNAGVLRNVLLLGTEEQKARWIGGLTSGWVAATGITEATVGSDIARVRTSAARSNGGYVLNGEKLHVTSAPIADFAVVLGRLPELGARDLTLFVVDPDTAGFRPGEGEDLFGCRTSPTGALHFENAVLDGAQVLGEPGDGLSTITKVMVFDRAVIALMSLGLISGLAEDALAFAQEREAFGVKIAEHEYVQGRITQILHLRETSRFVTYAAIDRILGGDPDTLLVAASAKLQASEAAIEATQHAMAVMGHAGYETGELSRRHADAHAARIMGGTVEMQRKIMFNHLARVEASRKEERKWLTSSPA